jgi:hypothetical protein
MVKEVAKARGKTELDDMPYDEGGQL